MHTMKDVCRATGMTYEALKFYCNEGLVPNVKRDEHNRRVFDDRDIAWIQSLTCLKSCGMSIQEMKQYMHLCLEGVSSIPARKALLNAKREMLLQRIDELHASIDYIDQKQVFFDDILSGKIAYHSNLICTKD